MEYKETLQTTDPAVTKSKFDSEVLKFQAVQSKYNEKGIICSKILFPNIHFVFSAPKLNPSPIVFAVRINFTNYDVEPPSIVFINPFTGKLVRRDQVPIGFFQATKSNPLQPIDLLQGNGDMVPFFCIPGIREYHNHPAHSGDFWFLYRKNGEGTLPFILDQLYNYSIGTARRFNINLNLAEMKLQISQEFKIER